jgi:acyl carrier protein
MNIEISDFIRLLEEEFELASEEAITPDTVIESVIEMSSINALIFLALIKTEYDVALTAGDLLHAKTIQDLFDVVVEKSK